MSTLQNAEDYLTVHYRLEFPDGERYAFAVEPVSPDVGRQIYGSINENYSFIIITYPERSVYPFLQGIQPQPDFIKDKMGVSDRTASFLSAIMSTLTFVVPADTLQDVADGWYQRNPK